MAKPGPRTTKRYREEFKATAVRLSELPGIEVQDVAASLYIHPFMLSRWRKQAREGEIVTKGIEIEKDVESELKELRKIKKAYERLQVEHDILRKAIEFTSERKARSSRSSTVADPGHSEGEERFLTFGVAASGKALVVAHSENGDTIRIISSREMTRQERRAYESTG